MSFSSKRVSVVWQRKSFRISNYAYVLRWLSKFFSIMLHP
jgi:hypothetical protein